jgi:hypothetical protein
MESEPVRRVRERAQELISFIDASIAGLVERSGSEAPSRARELGVWLDATTAAARRELPTGRTDAPSFSSLVKDVLFAVDLIAHNGPEDGIALDISVRGTPFVRGARWTVRRIVLDVLLDARAAEPRGGRLSIEVSEWTGQAVLRVENRGTRPTNDLGHTPTPRSLERQSNLIRVARALNSLGGGLEVDGGAGCGMIVTLRLPLFASRPNASPAEASKEDSCPRSEPTSPCA